MIWAALIAIDIVFVAGGSYLIVNDHPWFGGFLFLLAATASAKSGK